METIGWTISKQDLPDGSKSGSMDLESLREEKNLKKKNRNPVEMNKLKVLEDFAKKNNKKLDEISRNIKTLEKVLKSTLFPREMRMEVEKGFSVFWDSTKRRLMSCYGVNVRPVIEQPAAARVLLADKWDEFIDLILEKCGEKNGNDE